MGWGQEPRRPEPRTQVVRVSVRHETKVVAVNGNDVVLEFNGDVFVVPVGGTFTITLPAEVEVTTP